MAAACACMACAGACVAFACACMAGALQQIPWHTPAVCNHDVCWRLHDVCLRLHGRCHGRCFAANAMAHASGLIRWRVPAAAMACAQAFAQACAHASPQAFAQASAGVGGCTVVPGDLGRAAASDQGHRVCRPPAQYMAPSYPAVLFAYRQHCRFVQAEATTLPAMNSKVKKMQFFLKASRKYGIELCVRRSGHALD